MKQRLLVAAVGVPLLLVVLLVCPPWATGVLVCLISGIAAYELVKTACHAPTPAMYALTVLCALLVSACVPSYRRVVMGAGVALLFALSFLAVRQFGTEKPIPFADVCICMVGGALFPLMYGCITLLRQVGPVLVLMPFVIAFIGDSASMLAGSRWGKKKLAPAVSPNKTWAGFIAGPVGSALGMVLLGLIERLVWSADFPLLFLALLGAFANLIGQLGDLTTSLIKREKGIKDYSRLFLTHGGMLDRFDSSLFIAPMVYFFVQGGVI